MGDEPVRLALVGLGDIGLGAHLPALLRAPDVDVVALVDTASDRRATARGVVGSDVLLTGTIDDILGAGIDGVVLATPPWVTPDLTVRALRAGRHVLAEKPVATSVAAAEVYTELGDDERHRLQIGLTYRHDPAIQQLGEWIRDGRLGDPLLVRAHIYDERHDPADPEHAERIRQTLAHGLPVVHEGAHVLDWLSFLLGGPGEVGDAWALQSRADLPAPNVTGARLRYPGGHTALVEFGWLTDALPACELSVLGTRGHARLEAHSFRLHLTTVDGEEIADFPGEHLSRCFDRQVRRFVELIRGERAAPEPNLADGLSALRTAERIATTAWRS